MTNTLLVLPEWQIVDGNGSPLIGGLAYTYLPNTLTPAPTYQDAGGTILNTNPIVLDANGMAVVWGSGSFRIILTDADGNQIYDQVTTSYLGSDAINPVIAPALEAGSLASFRDLAGITAAISSSIAGISLLPGAVGPQGIQGLTGPQGPQGIQGPTGAPIFGSNSNGQYAQYPNFVMQWGSNSTSSDTFSGTFPIPFPNGCGSIVASPLVGIGGGQGACQTEVNSSSTFTVRTFSRLGPSSGPFFWQAFGN